MIRINIIVDDVFLNNFFSFKIINKFRLRYILKKINDSYFKEIVVLNDNNKIYFEYIMFIKVDGWDIIKEEYEEYLWKIGNFILLGSEYNKKLINKIFNDKKDIYEYLEV